MPIGSRFIKTNGINIHCLSAGDPANQPVVFLHGFPEFAGAWIGYLLAFEKTRYAVAPDQRGYSLTSKPAGVDAYQQSTLVSDMCSVIDGLFADKQGVLVGHDWGAAIAYGVCFRVPHKIERLVVINGVHPLP